MQPIILWILGNILPMRGMKSFVLGFSLSLFSMSVGGQLYSSAAGKTHLPLQTDIKIDLFKTKEDAINKAASDILTKVQKQTITTSAISGLMEKPSASAPDKADSFRFLSENSKKHLNKLLTGYGIICAKASVSASADNSKIF